MAAHTEGPWHVFASSHARERNQVEINSPDGLTVAYAVSFVPAYAKQSDANASLISSAPELLCALKAAIELLDDCEISHPLAWDNAIAKAEGR